MKEIKAAFSFVGFLCGYAVASVIYFQSFVYNQDHSLGVLIMILLFAAFSGILLALGLVQLSLFPERIWKIVTYGITTGVILFFALFATEDMLSRKRSIAESDASSFSRLQGHCGVYLGRALAHFYHQSWDPTLENSLREYEIESNCRQRHFLEIQKLDSLQCNGLADKVGCEVHFMEEFGKLGFWSVADRRMFFQILKGIWAENHGLAGVTVIPPASWQQFLITDHRLDLARTGILGIFGLKENMSPRFIYLKDREDLEQLQQTGTILDEFKKMDLITPNTADEATREQYQNTIEDIEQQLAKIDDLKQEVDLFRQKYDK